MREMEAIQEDLQAVTKGLSRSLLDAELGSMAPGVPFVRRSGVGEESVEPHEAPATSPNKADQGEQAVAAADASKSPEEARDA